MKRSTTLALLATLLLAAPAAALGGPTRPRPDAAARVTPNYGSVARTKLLNQVQRGKVDDVKRLGGVERRALLTGTKVNVPKSPHRRTTRR